MDRAAAAGFVQRLEAYRARFEEALASFLAEKRRGAGASRSSRELVDALEELVRGGGKRLRPALVHYTHRACGGSGDGPVLPLAMSTELLHTYLLIHDDIMDHSDVRRGRPAAHVRFGDRHRRDGWRGDPADFGRSAAILLGDLAHAWAVDLFARGLEEAGRRGPALRRAWAAMCEEVVFGQYQEMLLPHGEKPGEEELLLVLRLKSGRYSAERPMQLGALLAGASGSRLQLLREYGAAIGEVFQLQDDILGTFGEPERVGKPVGSDLREGKLTFLIHHVLRGGSERDRRRLRSMLGRRDLDRRQVEEARAIIRDSGGLAAVEEMIETRLRAARHALDRLDLDPDAHSFFQGLIAYSRERDR